VISISKPFLIFPVEKEAADRADMAAAASGILRSSCLLINTHQRLRENVEQLPEIIGNAQSKQMRCALDVCHIGNAKHPAKKARFKRTTAYFSSNYNFLELTPSVKNGHA
jgi:hypothetical protein